MVGLPKMVIQQLCVRGTRCFGDYSSRCCCSNPAILPAGTRMYLAYDTIVMEFSSSRPPLLSPFDIYNPLPHSLHLINDMLAIL